MTYPSYVRDKARALRVDRRMSIDEIAECLALPKTTIYGWVGAIPLGRPRQTGGQEKGTRAMVEKFRIKREEAYARGVAEFEELAREPTFRDFVALYVGEGSKRERNQVVICNSDPAVVVASVYWLRRLSGREPGYWVQHHADQDPDDLRAFWARELGADPRAISFLRKSNSSQLATRRWRCEHGVIAARLNDTYLRARMQAWMDLVRDEWRRLP